MEFNVKNIRKDFPILSKKVNDHSLIYFDNAATTQIPQQVLACIIEQYSFYQGNVHRGIHTLSELSTSRMEDAREKIGNYIGAAESDEIIFTSGTTASINIAARFLENSGLITGDIVTTIMEHHSNLIPWQQVCHRTGYALHIVPLTESGELDMMELQNILDQHSVSLVAVTCVSNVTGVINPISEIVKIAHEHGALVLLDGAQIMRHSKINVSKINCDFLCFSGHKMLAPTGTGILYGKKAILNRFEPLFYGGGMVENVTQSEATWDTLPFRLEPGTPNIVGNIAFGAAIDYLTDLGLTNIASAEDVLLQYIEESLRQRDFIHVLSTPEHRIGSISFTMDSLHPYDIAKLLDQLGIAVRSGHHCAQPLLNYYGINGAVRISPAFYNTKEEADELFLALDKIYATTKRR